MKDKPLAYIPINSTHKYEWACREEGSYEDSKQSETHVFRFISRKPHNRINIYSQQELDALIKSAAYCGDEYGDTDPQVLRNEAGIRRAYEKLILIRL